MPETGGDASKAPPATAPSAGSTAPKVAPANVVPEGNPAFRAMGLPNFRLKLPSRNWTIFLTIVGSWTGALLYDRRQKKKVQQKWCTLVEHIAHESLSADAMARKVTIVLEAPPGDGLRTVREHFQDYVKPVLVAGAMDWDVVEGRREGAVRAGVAERIRRVRRRAGEHAETEVEDDVTTKLLNMRSRTGIRGYSGVNGDLVIGRHTWKEYVRGLHEGWLGSLDPPKDEAPPAPDVAPLSDATAAEALPDQPQDPSPSLESSSPTTDDASPTTGTPPAEPETPKPEPEKPKKPTIAPAHNTTSSYADSSLPPSIPFELQPSTPIPFPHILGFLNTPIRMYRFLNRRHLADDVGRATAAAVLAAHRPWREDETTSSASSSDRNGEATGDVESTGQAQSHSIHWEQQTVLQHEEAEWIKSAKVRKDDDVERVWLDDMVIDPRIGRRMRRFELEPGDEERAKAIWRGAKGIPGRRAGDEGDLESESQ